MLDLRNLQFEDTEGALRYYPDAEWKKIIGVMVVFSDYIEKNETFELFYSEKIGCFFHITVSEEDREGCGVEFVETANDLFDYLIYEIANDVRELKLAGAHYHTSLFPVEAEEVRKRVEPYLAQFNENGRKRYTERFEEYLAEETEQ